MVADMGAFVRTIDNLKNCGVFHEWSKGQEFGRYNLIYGWNGSGKTTISRVFRSLEKGSVDRAFYDDETEQLPDDFSFKLKLADGKAVEDSNLAEWQGKVRVFNCDFVRENLNVDDGTAEPVFYLGEEQGEALQEFEQVSGNLKGKRDAFSKLTSQIDDDQKSLNTKLSAQAKTVSDLLAEKGFNRTQLTKILSDTTFQEDYSSHTQTESALDGLVKTSRGVNDHVKQPQLSFSPSIDLDELVLRTQEIAARTITKKVISELDQNAQLKNWVQTGLNLHENRKTCAFCSSDLTAERVEELNDYFNTAFKTLMSDIDLACDDIQTVIDNIRNVKTVEAIHLFSDYRDGYKKAIQILSSKSTDFINTLNAIRSLLQEKKEKSFEALTIPATHEMGTRQSDLLDAIAATNLILKKHEEHCEQFDEKVNKAKVQIRKHYASDIYNTYKEESEAITTLEEQKENLEKEISSLQTRYDQLNGLLSEHYPALSRINELLSAFMGRNDIILTANDKGYTIKRNGKVAKNLSEGEKTAIAFCYFISKMEEKDFEIGESIIIVDDPISSLDTNALYAAGAFIRMHLERAQQLFILTHNHRFFREMYGWIRDMKSSLKPAEGLCWKGHFMIKCETGDNNIRRSKLTKLDKLLMNYDNEYVYHCKLLFDAKDKLKFDENPSDEQLSQLILLPNIARKVMETFLLFKYPNQVKEPMKVYNAAKGFTSDMGQEKLGILDRLVNRASHGDDGKMSSVNVFDLDETPKVIQYVLDFIQQADEVHYNELQLACNVKSVNDNKKEAA